MSLIDIGRRRRQDGGGTDDGGDIETAPDDRYFDYCLEPYRPRRPPTGKLRSENLLWDALRAMEGDALRPVLETVQRHVGRDHTVWGVKHVSGALWLELYFYDPRGELPRSKIASVRDALGARLPMVETPDFWRPMMWSFDLRAGATHIDALNLYLTGEAHHAGRAYEATARGVTLTNTYRFLPPKTELDEMLALIEASVFVDFDAHRAHLAKVLLPELFACKKVCVSKKRTCDAIYFSGIDVDQLVFFLKRFEYPAPLVARVEARKERLDHLYFDVGIDYRQEGGRIVYPKTSYYGTL